MFLLLAYWKAIIFKGQKSFGYLVNLLRTDGIGVVGCEDRSHQVGTGEQESSTEQLGQESPSAGPVWGSGICSAQMGSKPCDREAALVIRA